MTFPLLCYQLSDMERKIIVDDAEREARRWRAAAIWWALAFVALLAFVVVEGYGG